MAKSDRVLVLDLDGTLVYTGATSGLNPNKPMLKIAPDFMIEQYAVYKRPLCDVFLNYCREFFRVGVWSNGNRDYVDDILQVLFNKGDLEFTLYYEDCKYPPKNSNLPKDKLIKDLKDLETKLNVPLSKIAVVDDEPLHYLDTNNLIKIPSWKGDVNDVELRVVQRFLSHILSMSDIRSGIKTFGDFRKYCDHLRPKNLTI